MYLKFKFKKNEKKNKVELEKNEKYNVKIEKKPYY